MQCSLAVCLFDHIPYVLFIVPDSNTQSSDLYTLSTNSGSETSQTHSKASSSDNLHTSPPKSIVDRYASNRCVSSDGSASPQGHSIGSGPITAVTDAYGDTQTVINLGRKTHIQYNILL